MKNLPKAIDNYLLVQSIEGKENSFKIQTDNFIGEVVSAGIKTPFETGHKIIYNPNESFSFTHEGIKYNSVHMSSVKGYLGDVIQDTVNN